MTAGIESLIFRFHGREDNSGQYLGKLRKKTARQGNDIIARARKINIQEDWNLLSRIALRSHYQLKSQ